VRPPEAATLAPPPGADAASWRATREDARRRCLACERMPMLGVLVAARGAGAVAPSSERSRLEAVAFSLAPMVENARLVHELARSQRFLADVVDSMPSALVAFDPAGHVLSLNRTAQELLGLDEAAASGRDVGELFGEEGEAYVRRTLASGQAVVRRETIAAPAGAFAATGAAHHLAAHRRAGARLRAIATFLDLTPLRAAEERARQLDQLAALGRFTSSVAHEIRNPLTGIGMGVRRLSKALREQPAEAEHVEFVLSEIRRLDGIVQELFDITTRASWTSPRGRSRTPCGGPSSRSPACSPNARFASSAAQYTPCHPCRTTPTRCSRCSSTCSRTPPRPRLRAASSACRSPRPHREATA
jgi:PAS domain S-box-containing protein